MFYFIIRQTRVEIETDNVAEQKSSAGYGHETPWQEKLTRLGHEFNKEITGTLRSRHEKKLQNVVLKGNVWH